MQTVGQQLGIGNLEAFRPHAAIVSPDGIGIELELEGFDSTSIDISSRHLHPLWTVTNDGSLRNGGVEFITAGGLGGERLYEAIQRMHVLLADRVNYDASWRCSTHMHINMLDFTMQQVARFMLVYAACEPVLFAHAGRARYSSNFCVPIGESLAFHRKLISRFFDDAVHVGAANNHVQKYTAMNFAPLFNDPRGRPGLGTAEFRGGRAMVTQEDMLLQVNLLLSIKNFVRSHTGDDEALLNSMSEGVLATVYNNGVAAPLEVPTEQLELAMVNAWLLLKSYQQALAGGRQYRREVDTSGERNQVRGNRFAAPTDLDGLLSQRIQSPDPLPFMSAAQAAAFGHSNAGLDVGINTEDVIRYGDNGPSVNAPAFMRKWTREEWPRIYHYWDNLCTDTTQGRYRGQKDVFISVLTDPRWVGRMPVEQAVKAWQGYVGQLGSGQETQPVYTVIRAGFMRLRGVYQSYLTDVPAHQQANAIMWGNGKSYYKLALPSATFMQIASLLGLPDMTSTREMVMALMNIKVRTKGRAILREAFANAGVSVRIGEEIPAVLMKQMILATSRSSVDHVFSADLPTYDKVCQAVDLLIANDLEFPVRYSDINLYSPTGRIVVFLRRHSDWSMGMGNAFMSQNTRANRLSPTTGLPVH